MPQFQNVFEIKVIGQVQTSSGGARNVTNLYHYRLSSGAIDTAQAVGAAFRDTVLAQVVPLLHNTYSCSLLLARLIDNTENPDLGTPVTLTGSTTGDRLPNMCAVVVRLNCAQRGKEFRGSKHFGPIAESDTVKDELIAATSANWKAMLPKLYNTIIAANGVYTPVVVSRKLSQLRLNPVSIVGSDVNGATLNLTVGTMRKRKERTVTG